MKIYFEAPNESLKLDEDLDVASIDIQSLGAVEKSLLSPLIRMVSTLKQSYAESATELIRYKVMWALRSVESEMDEEGGVVILKLSGNNEVRDFSPQLTDKINYLLSKNYKR